MFGEQMSQDYLKQLSEMIQGIGQLTRVWTATYQGFKAQKMTNEEALMHTQAFMIAMFRAVTMKEE